MNMSPSHHRTLEQGHAGASGPAGSHAGHDGHDHEAMIADFRRRFWVSLALTVPILVLSPMIQHFLGLAETLAFPGDVYVLFGLASVVYFWGGWPFLKGIGWELTARRPGVMTLIALAISVAYFYSSAVVFGLAGKPFFWELATLIDVMLLGHWIEMRSVIGASRALESLVRLLPATALRLLPDGGTEEVAVTALVPAIACWCGRAKGADRWGDREGRIAPQRGDAAGESRPVERGEGDEAIGGAINGEGSLSLEVRKTGDQTYLAQVIALVRQAQEPLAHPGRGESRRPVAHLDHALGRRGDALGLAGARRRGSVRGRAHGNGHGHCLPACAWARRAPGGRGQHQPHRPERSPDPRPRRLRAC